jgi:hypothetical protein
MFEKCGRVIVAASLVTLCGAAIAAAQNAAAPPARDPMMELLAEVRGLRAEMRSASDASIRAQLLVARLQLQEQRITTLSRQLVEAQRQLADNDKARGQLKAQMTMFGKDDPTESSSDKEGRDVVMRPLKSVLEQLDKADQDLKMQETSLLGLIAEEQAHWSAFNARLDELAKHIETRVK